MATSCFSKKSTTSSSKSRSPFTILEDLGYTFGKTIAEGSYCNVQIVTRKEEKYAVKVIKFSKNSPEFMEKFLPRELSILPTLEHRNIIKVFDIYQFDTHAFIFMELLSKGDLLDYIKNRIRLPEEEAQRYFCQLISALQYLHRKAICHRDFKCENIMIDDENQVKLIDFGFSRSCLDKNGKRILSDTFCGSTAYAAPEILLGKSYNPMMYDIWSLGCVLFIMVCGSMPFDDSNVKLMVRNQWKRKVKFPGVSTIISAEVKDLIRHLLEPDITKRANLEQIFHDPWVTGKPRPSVRQSTNPRLTINTSIKLKDEVKEVKPETK